MLLEEMRNARARSRSVCSSVLFSLSRARKNDVFKKEKVCVRVKGVKRLCVSLFLFMRCILLQLDIVCVYMSRSRGVNLRFSSSGRFNVSVSIWTAVLFGVVQTLEVVVFASEKASPRIPRRAVFVQVFEDIELARFGSKCTRKILNWTFMLHAILYDVKMTMLSCLIDRPIIPIILFLFSQPTKQREVSRKRCSSAEKILRFFSLELSGLSPLHWWIASPNANHEGLLQLPL